MKEIDQIIAFFERKCPNVEISGETRLFELMDDSISFITSLSELEDEIDQEICIEQIEDITKLTIADIIKYI